MTTVLRSLFVNRSILLQLGAALIFCQLLVHGLTIAMMIWRYERPDLLNATSVATTQAVGFHEMLTVAPVREREALARAIEQSHPFIRLVEARDLPAAVERPEWSSAMFEGLAKARPDLAAEAILIRAQRSDFLGDRIALKVDDGRYLEFAPDDAEQRITLPRIVASLFVAMVVAPLAVLAFWAVAMLTAPLRKLAASAERFSIDLDPTPLPERGPAEIRKLAHAFNTMRGRIRQLVDSRSRMLAAVSHDLRTPLTRLRLKTEALVDGEDKEKMLRDIGTMNAMIGHALSYLRDQTAAPSRERVDLPALLESICHDYEDVGCRVSFTGPRNVVLECDPDLLTRAVSNLIDNAIKFGGSAEVELEMPSPTVVAINIVDEGPGIPDDQKALALEPFNRGDQARHSPDTEGFGLGLAIASQIVERHGGRITLEDRAPRGLRARIELPHATSQWTSQAQPALSGLTLGADGPSGGR